MGWRATWDNEPRSLPPFVPRIRWGLAKWLVVACVVVTVLAAIADKSLATVISVQPVSMWLGLTLDNAVWIYPFFSYAFLHDIDSSLLHLILNGLLLWFLGAEVEERFGRGRFLTLFFGAALLGAVLHLTMQGLFGTRETLLMGASGGLYGILFFIARSEPQRPFVFFIITIPAWLLALIFLAMNLYPLLRLGLTAGGIAVFCHLGGAAFGWYWCAHRFDATTWFRSLRQRMEAASATSAARRAADDDEEMDRLLQKIRAEGMPSLTPAERSFLDERSRKLRDRR